MNVFVKQNGLRTFLKPWLNTLDLICLKLVCKSFKQVIDQLVVPIKDYDSCKWIVNVALTHGYWKLADHYLEWLKYHVPKGNKIDSTMLCSCPVKSKEDALLKEKIFENLFPNQTFSFDRAVETGNPFTIQLKMDVPPSIIWPISNPQKVWKQAMEQQNIDLIRHLRKRECNSEHLFPIDLGNCTSLEIAKLATWVSNLSLRKGKCSWEVTQYIMENWSPPLDWIIYEYLKHGKTKEASPYLQSNYDLFISELNNTPNEESLLLFFDEFSKWSGFKVYDQFIHFVNRRFSKALRILLEKQQNPISLEQGYLSHGYLEAVSRLDPSLIELLETKTKLTQTALPAQALNLISASPIPFLRLWVSMGALRVDDFFQL